MKRVTKVVLVTLASVGIVGGAAAYAGSKGGCGFGHGNGGHRMGGHMVERISDRMDLSADQEEKLDNVFDEMRQMRRDVMRDRKDNIQEVLSLLDAPKLDQDKAMAMFNDKAEAIKQHAPEIVAALAEFSDGLSPEQKQQVRDMMEHRFDRYGKSEEKYKE
ncbi:MAG: periplasmic heavy metal sensor [Gammaproteobacteria bacterium]|nr:periplasmic heavy metal sensor [Gammaproteobacteria bacterium]